MTTENQCCTLGQAKKLKELGVGQQSLFSWIGEPDKCAGTKHSLQHTMPAASLTQSAWSAFTVAELDAMLPDQPEDKKRYGANVEVIKGPWKGGRYQLCTKGSNYHLHGTYKTMASATADLLIYLLEVCELPVAEVNERLKQA